MRHRGIPTGSGQGRAPSALAGLALAFLLLIPGCGSIGDPETCGTDYPDPDESLAGCLTDEDILPVAGVMVIATRTQPPSVKRSASASSIEVVAGDTAETDGLGRYGFKGLDEGWYVLTGSDSLGRALKADTVRVEGRPEKMLEHVLYRTGTLQITVMDTALGVPVHAASCDVPGKSSVMRPDLEGRIEMPMPPGTYTLRCEAKDFQTAWIEDIEVRPSESIPVEVIMTEVPRPPPPDSVDAKYDPITGVVHLSWSKVKFSSPVIYWVRAVDPTLVNNPSFPLNTLSFTMDTNHADIIYWPPAVNGGTQAKSKTIVYNIGTSLTSDYSLSRDRAEVKVLVTPPAFLGPRVSLRSLDSNQVFKVGDTARVVGEYHNPYRINTQLDWLRIKDGAGLVLKPSRILADSSGSDTLFYPCAAPGMVQVRMKVADEGGLVASGDLTFEIKDP